MASVSLITSAGVSGSAMPTKARSVSLLTRAGVASATGRVPWAGSYKPAKDIRGLPDQRVPLVDSNGNMTLPWYRYHKWLFEERLGGIKAPTVPQITLSVTQTQTQASATQSLAEQAVTYASGVAATASATAEVAVASGLTGATSIPDVPEPPRYFDQLIP